MKLDLRDLKISLVICPYDLRAGFDRLAVIANNFLGIDVSKGKDCVIFLSRQRNFCKLIYTDTCGSVLICRRLHQGRFQQLLIRADAPAVKPLTFAEMLSYLDGDDIEIKRKSLLKN